MKEQGIWITLAPTIVAVVVAVVAMRQNRWQRQHAQRLLDLDERELKLALLERRTAVLKAVAAVVGRLSYHRHHNDKADAQIFNVLIEGQTLFNAELAKRLNEVWLGQVEYHNAWLGIHTGTHEVGAVEKRTKAAEAIRQPLFDQVQELLADLTAETRINGPANICECFGWWAYLRAIPTRLRRATPTVRT